MGSPQAGAPESRGDAGRLDLPGRRAVGSGGAPCFLGPALYGQGVIWYGVWYGMVQYGPVWALLVVMVSQIVWSMVHYGLVRGRYSTVQDSRVQYSAVKYRN